MPAGGHDPESGPVAVAMEVVEGATGMTLPLKIKLKLHNREDIGRTAATHHQSA